jgi:hypothetical protein
MSGFGRGRSEEAIKLALLLYCEARHVARRELLIYTPSIAATKPGW